jgi:hypothetical protein
MSEPDRLLTKQEIISRLRAASQKSKPKPPAPTAVEKAEARFAGKRDEARLQDIVAHSTDAERYFEEQMQKYREFQDEQIRLSNDPARNNHINAAYRRAVEAVPAGHGAYYRAGEVLQATRQARVLQSRYASGTVGPDDSDSDLHYSAEQQIWGK